MNRTADASKETLSFFIRANLEPILEQWEAFARSIPSAHYMDVAALRDHASGILASIATDLERSQTPQEQLDKSPGRTMHAGPQSQASLHGAERAAGGFSVNEALSEFRALRTSVMRLLDAKLGAGTVRIEELIRFNEAIDAVLAESIERYGVDKEEFTRRFDTLLSFSPDLNFIVDRADRLIYANSALVQLCGSPAHGLIGQKFLDLCIPFAGSLTHDMHRVFESGAASRGDFIYTQDSGAISTYRYILLPVMNRLGKVESVSGTARNISELKESEEKIRRNAYYDGLTGLPNRTLFRDRLEQEVMHAARGDLPLALLFIDLDGFKEVNDLQGHDGGDQLLQECARRISSCVRGTDTVARIGGDEFTVILGEVANTLHVEILAQKILDKLATPFSILHQEILISASIGITFYPFDASTPADLVRNADQAMYVAKRAGRNRFSFFTASMRESAWARLKLIGELRRALPLRELSVFYQPIIDLPSGVIVKAEALLRWQHPLAGMRLPDEFISLSEETGLIGDMGEWVLSEAIERARDWTALLGAPFQISVNKSPIEFMSKTLLKNWEAHLTLLESANHCIVIEITEGVLLNDSEVVKEKLSALKQAGVQLAIDDFGIGYSSMAYLKKFKVDLLKIDKSFVRDITSKEDSRIFSETIIIMAHKLGLKVIAEGVETAGQRDWLKAVGCDYAQGFLYSEAVPAEEFEKLLGANGGRAPTAGSPLPSF